METKEIFKPSVSGHVKAITLGDSSLKPKLDIHNEIQIEALKIITRGLAGDNQAKIDNISLHSQTSPNPDGLVSIKNIDSITFPSNDSIKFIAIFDEDSFTGLVDEIRLVSSFFGTFSKIENLSLVKGSNQKIAIAWQIRVSINEIDCDENQNPLEDCSGGAFAAIDWDQAVNLPNFAESDSIPGGATENKTVTLPIRLDCCDNIGSPQIVSVNPLHPYNQNIFNSGFPYPVQTVGGFTDSNVKLNSVNISLDPQNNPFLSFNLSVPYDSQLNYQIGVVDISICGITIPIPYVIGSGTSTNLQSTDLLNWLVS